MSALPTGRQAQVGNCLFLSEDGAVEGEALLGTLSFFVGFIASYSPTEIPQVLGLARISILFFEYNLCTKMNKS